MEVSPSLLLQAFGTIIVVGTAWVNLSNKIAEMKVTNQTLKDNHDVLQKSFNDHKDKSEETLQEMRREIKRETDSIKEMIHTQSIMLTEINMQLNPKNRS